MKAGRTRLPDRRGTAHAKKPAELTPPGYGGVISPAEALRIPLPSGMPRSKAAKTLWQTLLAEVARSELRPGDVPTLEACFRACWRARQASAMIDKFGLMVKGGPDGVKVNPMIAVELKETAMFDRLAQRLGLSPEARVRLGLLQLAGMSLLGSLQGRLAAQVEAEVEELLGEDDVLEVED